MLLVSVTSFGRWARLVLAVMLAVRCTPAGADSPPDYESVLARLGEKCGVEVIYTEPVFPIQLRSGVIEGRAANRADLHRYTKLLEPDFSLYPPALIKQVRLRRIVLCEALSFEGQRRTALPDFEHDTLYLDVSRGWHSPRYLCTVIHHEFFHMIDYRDDGSVYRDERWSSLNSSSFKYGTGGRNAQNDSTTSVLTSSHPGFLTHYSTTGVEEDKAEVFAHLIVNSAYVEQRVQSDPVLKAKVAELKARLFEFCPAVNEAFWNAVSQLKRDQF